MLNEITIKPNANKLIQLLDATSGSNCPARKTRWLSMYCKNSF